MVDYNSVFNKLAAEEDAFLDREFFSPALRNHPIRVRIAGIVMNLRIIEPRNYEGWGVFQPISHNHARLVREASLGERAEYLRLFPRMRLILCARRDGQWFGIPANEADKRFKVEGMVPVSLAGELRMFEQVICRFDGAHCWFDDIDPSQNTANAAMLRDALSELTDNARIEGSGGISKEEKLAYGIALAHEIEDRKDLEEERIKIALTRGGAKYRSYVDRGDTYSVEYTVDGHRHTAIVNKETLEVQTAGICLSGRDRNFDMQSLVGVMKEHHRSGWHDEDW